jgi:hypothetical protein
MPEVKSKEDRKTLPLLEAWWQNRPLALILNCLSEIHRRNLEYAQQIQNGYSVVRKEPYVK